MQTTATTASTPSSPDRRIETAAALPADINPPAKVVGSLSGPGVYFWTTTKVDSRIFFWDDASRTMRSWPVGSQALGDLPFTADYGLAVDHEGVAWLGVDQVLVRLDTTTGDIKRWSVPLSAPSAIPRTPQIVIHALSVNEAAGKVAIAETGGTDVQVLSTATGTFERVGVPANTAATDVAYTDTGELAIGLVNQSTGRADQLLISHPTGDAQVVATDAQHVMASHGDIVAAASGVTFISATGQITSRATSDALLMDAPPALLPDRRIAGQGRNSVVILSGSTTQAELPLGTVSCRGRSGLARSGSDQCPTRATSLAADAAGNVWLLTSNPAAGLDVIRHGST